MAWFDNITRARALETSEVPRIFALVNDEGYDNQCGHGGPESPDGAEEFCKAAQACEQCLVEARHRHFEETPLGGRGGAADYDADLTGVAAAELEALFEYWAPAKERDLLTKDVPAVCFSRAVDALYFGEATTACFFGRLGAFASLAAELGLEAARADLKSAEPDARARVRPLVDALRATTSDRALVAWLKPRIPCACLSALCAPGRCLNCMKPCEKPKKCARCKDVTYCDRDCQAADWNRHRYECRPCPKEEETAPE